MNGNIVVDWADSILEIAESACKSFDTDDKDKSFMEIIGICDAIFKALGYTCKYTSIKYVRFFEKLAGKDTTVIDWVLSVVDLALHGSKAGYFGKDKALRCIIGVCKTIRTTLGYVYPEDKRKQVRDFAEHVSQYSEK